MRFIFLSLCGNIHCVLSSSAEWYQLQQFLSWGFPKVKNLYLKCEIWSINTRGSDCLFLTVKSFITSRMCRWMNNCDNKISCILFLGRKKKKRRRRYLSGSLIRRKQNTKTVEMEIDSHHIQCNYVLLMCFTSTILTHESGQREYKLLEGSISLGRWYVRLSLKMHMQTVMKLHPWKGSLFHQTSHWIIDSMLRLA